MTQQKTRATTLQQKFGFQDADLSTPVHDALMVWLDQNVESVLLNRYSRPRAVENPRYIQGGPRRTPDEFVRILNKVWEKPISAKNGFLVGFVDMRVDVLFNPLDDDYWNWEPFLFEVKPAIYSVGELIRQIRMYQQYQEGTYIVVSPDDRFASVLAGQGIEFLKAPNL